MTPCGAPSGGGSGGAGGSGGSGGSPPPTPQTDGGCSAYNPGAPTCSFTATTADGISGYGSAPGGWTVTISRPGLAAPLVVRSLGGTQTYQCGTIRAGDAVSVTAEPGSFVGVGNPGICF